MRGAVKTVTAAVMAVLMLAVMICPAWAVNTAKATELLDPAKTCSLTLTYEADGAAYEGLVIQIYKVASLEADLVYRLTDAFAPYALAVNDIDSQGEWQALADTITSYMNADGIVATATGTTDGSGKVTFNGLYPGLYYVRRAADPNRIADFGPYMLSLPDIDEDGHWDYSVEARPKADFEPEPDTPYTPPVPPPPKPPVDTTTPGTTRDTEPPETTPGTTPGDTTHPGDTPEEPRLTVVKQWRDGALSAARPDAVEIEIFCGGESWQKVTLTADQNWTYSWPIGETSDADWTVVERDVPEGYTVTIQHSENRFCITNTSTKDPGQAPQTGDTSHLPLYLVIAALSGTALVILGVTGKKKGSDHE